MTVANFLKEIITKNAAFLLVATIFIAILVYILSLPPTFRKIFLP
jgi:hypothetical protein